MLKKKESKLVILDEPRPVLVRQRSTTSVERVSRRESEQVRHFGGVDICETKEAPREVRRVVVRTEQAAKLPVELVLVFQSKTKS